VSFGIANQVLETGSAVRSDDAISDPRFRERHSVHDLGIRSVLCAPLRRRGSPPLGVLYVDRLSSEIPFAPGELESLQGLANVAAVAVENARLRQEGAKRVRVEEELRHARELERLKSDFLSMVSHDLRTPLTSIKSWAEILEDDWQRIPDGERIRYLAIVNRECDRLTRLIDDLLDLQRADSGRMSIQTRPTPPEDLLRRAADTFQAAARARGIDLQVSCDPGLPPVQADPERIAQVLANLIGNALKFTPAGGQIGLGARPTGGQEPDAWRGRTVTIDLDAIQASRYVTFSVADSGEGIPEEMQETIFERFRQVDSAQKGRPRGSGLGLSICREIVERHGGSISVQSRVGSGSTFSFQLPVARDALDTLP
jgi:signal transduction histidine kinase